MARGLLILALVAAVFWVFTIVDCAVQPPTRHRGVSKGVWILIVVLLPVLGGILWLVVGRTRKSVIAQRKAPDDDPEFLGRIGSISDQDERIRRLEEELAQLDSEDDDPRFQPPARPAASDGPADSASDGSTLDAPAADSGTPPAPKPPSHPADGEDDTRGQRGAVG
ncbi:PLDc_N domain-containing protein [Microbacterium sp. CFH 90308]|uniref:PLDc_N domain-containing protein n=1 Tax=Microbacterium salsuginis TaxID=2722803 RepID=A0ABX1K7Q2_9MICO|nr:PLD nuclease N-terminal domain-containing protein [Microbacterium sp. CFH 90308]NLP83042.1 PLDc_N domain-containing protein [Microbacterium sp. CFH 90308]